LDSSTSPRRQPLVDAGDGEAQDVDDWDASGRHSRLSGISNGTKTGG